MLTSAVFLRAASFGIPTAQPLKRGIGRSFTAIARCCLLFQNNKESTVTFADRIRQEKSHALTISPSPKTFARRFTPSAVCRPSCDWGSLCDSSECREMARKPICEICRINPTVHTSGEWGYDRKGISSLTFTSFCEECLAKKQEEYRIREEARSNMWFAHRERIHKMLDHVNSLPPGEQVPIAYAVDKVSSIWGRNSAALRQRAFGFRYEFQEKLLIIKVKNRWICDKGRVDATDFKLWNDTRLAMWRIKRRE
ncbi:hypothetical protein B0T13DRAFT_476703 [Neurospora crassa]|nr:hypothetical protein B0T13DRAFT_476703 [Neurospora crassa]